LKRLKVSLKDFEEWLLERHLPEFKSELYVREFVSSGFAFLVLSGSSYLRKFIIEMLFPEFSRLSLYLAWSLASSCIVKLSASRDVLEIEADESKLKDFQKPLKLPLPN